MQTHETNLRYEQLASYMAELVFCYQKDNPDTEQRAVVNRILADNVSEVTVDEDSTVSFNCTSKAPVSELIIEFYVNGQPHKLILKSEAY